MRICFYGGPGCGKSTIASKLFADLKSRNYSVELVHEYIKKWAYLKRIPKSFDQVYIFGQQLYAEDLIYQSGVKHLVTDSPLCLQPFYSKVYNFPAWNELLMIAKRYETVHPSINIFLDREGLKYEQNGRYEGSDLALQRDRDMRQFLQEQCVPFVTFKTTDYESILDYVDIYMADPDIKAENVVRKELKRQPKQRKPRRFEDKVQDYTCYDEVSTS